MKKIFILLAITSFLTQSCLEKDEKFDASGTFEATEIIVSSESTGKIIEFNVEEGQILEKNQFLGYIDTTQIYLTKLQLLTTATTVKGSRLDVSKQIAAIEQQIVTAKSEKIRIEKLVNSEAAKQKDLDDINAQILVLEKQLAATKSTLDLTNYSLDGQSKSLEVQIEQINNQLQKCKIISPISGTVLVKYAEKDEFALTSGALFKIADLEDMILRAYVTSEQLTQLKLGQEVKVSADFGEEYREYSGKITWISSKSEFTPKTIQTKDERANLVYAIKISIENDGYLKIGMYGNVKFSN